MDALRELFAKKKMKEKKKKKKKKRRVEALRTKLFKHFRI